MNQSLKTTIASLALASALALTGCGSMDSSKDTSKTDSKDKTTETTSKTEDKKKNEVTTDDKKAEETKTEDTKTESASSDKKTESSSSSDKKTDTSSSSNKTSDNKTSSSSSDNKTSSTSSSKPSSSSSSSSASHTHTWVDDVATKQVQTGTKTVYEEVYHEAVEHQEWVDEGSCNICNVCGFKMYTDNDVMDHFDDHASKGESFGYHYELIGRYEWVTDTPAYTEKIEKQEPVYETQTYVTGQHCSTCGAKK